VGSERYFCTCFLNRYGKIREKKYAHIEAVILYQKNKEKTKTF